jgi:hypothetical protein
MKSQIDYLRLASWGHEPYTDVMSALMQSWPSDWERGKWLQYAGWRKESFFIGMGVQNKKRHAIMQASGHLAHKMHPVFQDFDNWYCTRFDIQRTVKKPEWVDLPKLHKLLGRKGTSLISSEENDTLYIGSRASDKFVRLYEKMFDEMYLRLEYELKGKRALLAWDAINEGEDCDRVFDYYLAKCKLPRRYLELFKNIENNATEKAMTKARETTAENKLKWITSLDSSIRAALGDHDIGERAKVLVHSWSAYADKIDENNLLT